MFSENIINKWFNVQLQFCFAEAKCVLLLMLNNAICAQCHSMYRKLVETFHIASECNPGVHFSWCFSQVLVQPVELFCPLVTFSFATAWQTQTNNYSQRQNKTEQDIYLYKNGLNVLCCSLWQTISCERTNGTAADKRYTTNLNITNDKKDLFPPRKRKRPISHHICFLQLLTTFLHINPCPNIRFLSFFFFWLFFQLLSLCCYPLALI